MVYNFRFVVNHVLRKTEFGPVSESIDAEFTGTNVDPIVDRIKDWVNEVYLEICNAGFWRFLETEGTINTTASQEAYTLAPDCRPERVINVRETLSPKMLVRADFKDIDRQYPDTVSNTPQVPQYYYFVNDQIYLYPVPDRNMVVKYRYYRTVEDLQNPEDVPVIPENWKWVLVNGVMIRANQYLQDQSYADAQMQYFNGMLQMRAANRADRQKRNSIKPL